MPKYILGIDIGTSNVKISIIFNNKKLYSHSKAFKANLVYNSEKHEQDPIIILSAVNECLASIPDELAKNIKKIGVSGQMHGCMLWNDKVKNGSSLVDIPLECISSLYTWEDKRTLKLIPSLPMPLSTTNIYAGYGCVTMFWLFTQNDIFQTYKYSGTIADFVVFLLCKLSISLISYQNATSWGYFDSKLNSWNYEILKKLNFPTPLLPTAVPPDTIAGQLALQVNSIPLGIPVYVAMGDLQCSVYACHLDTTTKAIINIGTSSQVAIVMPLEFAPTYIDCRNVAGSKINMKQAIEYVPFFDNRYLAIAPSLNGGNILAMFITMLKNWFKFFDVEMGEEEIWHVIESKMTRIMGEVGDCEDTLLIKTTVFAERYAPTDLASVQNITPESLSFEKTFFAVCRGIVQNLVAMMPREFLVQNNVDGIVGVGKALAQNPILQHQISKQYSMKVEVPDTDFDSSYGVALAISNNFKVDH